MGVFSVRLSDDEEKLIEELVNTGKARNKREALEILILSKYMEKEIEKEKTKTQQSEDVGIQNLGVKKLEEVASKVILNEYLKRNGGADNFLAELGKQYILSVLNNSSYLMKKLEEYEKKLKELENDKEKFEKLVNAFAPLGYMFAYAIAKKMGIDIEGGENEGEGGAELPSV